MHVLTVSSLTLYKFEMHMQCGLLPFSNFLCFLYNAVTEFHSVLKLVSSFVQQLIIITNENLG